MILFTAILADAEGVYESYRFDIRPPTDDQPFFFHYFKWRQTPEILATLGVKLATVRGEWLFCVGGFVDPG